MLSLGPPSSSSASGPVPGTAELQLGIRSVPGTAELQFGIRSVPGTAELQFGIRTVPGTAELQLGIRSVLGTAELQLGIQTAPGSHRELAFEFATHPLHRQPRSGDRYLAWGVSPRKKATHNQSSSEGATDHACGVSRRCSRFAASHRENRFERLRRRGDANPSDLGSEEVAEVGAVAGDQEIGAGRDGGGEDRRVTVLKTVTRG